jgi:hypothetical protein
VSLFISIFVLSSSRRLGEGSPTEDDGEPREWRVAAALALLQLVVSWLLPFFVNY